MKHAVVTFPFPARTGNVLCNVLQPVGILIEFWLLIKVVNPATVACAQHSFHVRLGENHLSDIGVTRALDLTEFLFVGGCDQVVKLASVLVSNFVLIGGTRRIPWNEVCATFTTKNVVSVELNGTKCKILFCHLTFSPVISYFKSTSSVGYRFFKSYLSFL